ncbi:MAG: dihydrodipicolinate synthase family protein [Firmicutes bacterium]|nr:dihydrodipicolinate synthase family protein [Bacillota bacterium]
MSNVLFTGVMSALVSPLREDGSINEQSARALMRWQLDAGLAGFYVCGASGEGVVMRPEARKRLTELAVEEAAGRGAVIAHVGAVDMRTAVELAEHAASAGANAVASVPPFFYPYALPEIAAYYRALAGASGLPTLVYATPMAGTAFTRDMVAALMEIEGVVGLKWTNPDYYAMGRIKQIAGGDINVLNGPDETLLCGLCMGADGGIGSTYNVMPSLYARLYGHFKAGRLEEARAAQLQANRIIEVLLEYGVLPGIKEMLSLLGFDMGYCTPPLKRFSGDERAAFFDRLAGTGWPEAK